MMASKRNFECFCSNSFMHFFYLKDLFYIPSRSPLPRKLLLQEKIFGGQESFLYCLTQVNQKVVQQQRCKPTFICGMQYVNTNFDQMSLREEFLELWFWVFRVSSLLLGIHNLCALQLSPQSIQKPAF